MALTLDLLPLSDAGRVAAAGQRDGCLDSTFGKKSLVRTDLQGNQDKASSMAIQADGRIVVAGASLDGNNIQNFGLARYETDGTLDQSRGVLGKVTTAIAGGAWATGLALQGDGRIVVAGYMSTNTAEEQNFALARYNADGSLDTTFGNGGTVMTDFELDVDRLRRRNTARRADRRRWLRGESRPYVHSLCARSVSDRWQPRREIRYWRQRNHEVLLRHRSRVRAGDPD